MSRSRKETQVRLDLHKDQLAIGRMVKTVTYSPKLLGLFAQKLPAFPLKDVSGWCNLAFRVHGFNEDRSVITLRYDVRGYASYTTWPIEGLSKAFGIRL